MKTLAELKRDLTPGKKITLMYNSFNYNKFIGIERTIQKVRTNAIGIATTTPDNKAVVSWFDLPKASLLEYENNTFTIYYLDDNGNKIKHLIYKITN